VSVRTLLRGYRGALYLLLPLALVDGLLDGGLTLSYKFLVDDAIVPRNVHALILILAALASGALIGSLLSLWRDLFYARTVSNALATLREALFTQSGRLSMHYLAAHESTDVSSRFSMDLAGLDAWLSGAINSLVLPVMNILVGIGLLFFLVGWRLAIPAILVWPIVLIGPRLVAPHAAAAASRKRTAETALLSSVQESLATARVVRVFGLRDFMRARFLDRLAPLSRSTTRATFLGLLAERTTVITIYVVQIASVAVGSVLAFHGQLSVGSFLSFLTAFWNLGWSTVVIARSAPTIVLADVAVRRLDQLLGESVEEDDDAATAALSPMRDAIEFDGVTFGYPDRDPIFSDLTLRIARGDFVGFVGPSGAGKSTVFNLLAGFYRPSGGRILVDGVDVSRTGGSSLRSQIGFVLQDSILFNATVGENIRVGRLDATAAEVEIAAREAQIHDTIAALPQGYDTIVGEGGATLSGGQRQRVCIARALIRRPSVMLLDEATSALDPGTELAVNATLMATKGDRTTIAITHRLASVTQADRIFVLNNGVIEESGTHAQLLERDATYAALWRKQSGFVISRDGAAAQVTVKRLRDIQLLRSLDDAQLAALAEKFTSVRAEAGQVVIRQNDPGDLFYIIVRGRVAVTREGADAAEALATLSTGDEFGETALLHDSPRNATVTALVDSLFLTLSREQFQEFLASNAAIRDYLERVAADRTWPSPLV
jgi:ATP-binding cassette, subfamily B, bacterial